MIIITIIVLINQRYFILSASYFNHRINFLMRQLHPTIISSYISASMQLHCRLLRSFCHLYTEERGSTQ